MNQKQAFKLQIEKDKDGEAHIVIPEDIWEELLKKGWNIGDNVCYESSPNQLKLINMELRRQNDPHK